MSEEKDVYHLGTSDKELERLAYQHQVWQDATLRLWSLAGFRFDQTLLDLGCGPGFATVELARLVGESGKVHAFDESPKFTTFLQRNLAASGLNNVRAQTADVHAIGLDDNSIDGAFARWLLCFVKEPAQVCAEVARVLKPGGVFAAWDYFNYGAVRVFPEQAAIQRLFALYQQSAIDHGGSYDIGQQLPEIMLDCGLEIDHMEPINRVARPGSPIWHWASLFHAGYVPKLVESGMMTEQEAKAFWKAWRNSEKNPAAFFCPPPMLGIIARKS